MEEWLVSSIESIMGWEVIPIVLIDKDPPEIFIFLSSPSRIVKLLCAWLISIELKLLPFKAFCDFLYHLLSIPKKSGTLS